MSATIIAREQLLSVIERVERLDEEIKGINDDKKEIYAEAKANGFCTKTIKKIIGVRRKDAAQREEEDAIFDLYMHAIGMVPANARVHAHEKTNSVRDSDAAAPPKGTSESLSLPAGGGKPEEAGNLSNSEGSNPIGGPGLNVAPAESASEEISVEIKTPLASFTGEPDGAPVIHASDRDAQKSVAVLSGAEEGPAKAGGTDRKSEEAVTLSTAAPPPKNAADTPEGSEPSGLSSNRGQTNPVVPAKAEEAVPSTPQSQASSAATHTQPVRTKSGKGDRLPVPPPRHVPDLPSFLDRRKMNLPPKGSTENINGNIRETERAR